MLPVELISVCIGTIIGLVLALTGAGGAMLAIPLLVIGLSLTIFQAAPIALLAVFVTSSIAALQGLHYGTVRYKTALLIASLGVMLAPFGVALAQQTSNVVLSAALSCILLFVSILTWKNAADQTTDNSHLPTPACLINPATSKIFWTASCTKQLTLTGAVTGFLSGLLGVGGGFIIVPSLNKVSNFNHQTVIATTLAAVAIIAVSSIASHSQASTVNWEIAVPFAISSSISMIITTKLISSKIPKQASQKAFALLCLLAAIYLFAKSIM